jgi:hypothetical protein
LLLVAEHPTVARGSLSVDELGALPRALLSAGGLPAIARRYLCDDELEALCTPRCPA